MRVLIVGGNGFVGSAIVKQALARQWQVVSISRSGKPFITPAGHRPAWSSSPLVSWKAGDALSPETFRDLARDCDAVITTTGILLESSYKSEKGSASGVLKGLLKGWGWKSANPLGGEKTTEPRYEVMNRDAALCVAKTFSEARSHSTPSPFIYISAEDIFRPVISSRYIETKRQAEDGIRKIADDKGSLRPIFLRPGLMYHPQTRPLSTLPAAAFDLSSWLHGKHVQSGIPLPTAAALLQKFPGADLSALARLLTLQPLHVDTVAKAACASIVDSQVHGAVNTEEIQRLAGFKSSRSPTAGLSPSVGGSTPWPTQRRSAHGQRGFSTSSRCSSRRYLASSSEKSSSGSKGDVFLPMLGAMLVAACAIHFSQTLENEALELTQQEQMRKRAHLQGVYTWGSNRYNVVAPDVPLTTFIKTPRSIPYFDGMALRDLAMEERYGVAVDAVGDVLQWGLGFFDASLENINREENLDDVPLARRREKEKANELTPRGSLGAVPLPPVKTLVGKDIVKVTTSDSKIYALSRHGKVYIFSSVQRRQWPGKAPAWSWNPFSLFGTLDSSEIDHVVMQPTPAAKFGRSERVVDIKAGSHHLLALSNKGRTFSCPIDPDGNAFGQLGLRKVLLGDSSRYREVNMAPRMLTDTEPAQVFHQGQILPAWALPPGLEATSQTKKPVWGPENRGIFVRPPQVDIDALQEKEVEGTSHEELGGAVGVGGRSTASSQDINPFVDIRFCSSLHEIPALKDTNVVQIASGSDHSVARTDKGKIFGWGRQTHGQTGIGAQIAMEAIPIPTEVVLSKAFPNSSVDIACTDVKAGADNTFFTMYRREPANRGLSGKIDLLAVGKGQWGTLGNAMWNQVTVVPARVKTVSGLQEFSEKTQQIHPIPIHDLMVGKPGSVAIVLDTVEPGGHQTFGRDVMVFGHNAAYQLGTGKRSNLAVPQHLQPLPPPTDALGADAPPVLRLAETQQKEADINSGVLTHMPHHRLQLASTTQTSTHAAPSKPGKQGKRKRKVAIEETITVGAVSMAIFWKIQK